MKAPISLVLNVSQIDVRADLDFVPNQSRNEVSFRLFSEEYDGRTVSGRISSALTRVGRTRRYYRKYLQSERTFYWIMVFTSFFSAFFSFCSCTFFWMRRT